MIDFIVKYWLQVLFGLIAAGLGFIAKHYYGLWKKEKENKQNQILDSIKEELKTYNQEIVTQKEALLTSEDVKLQEAIKKVEESNNQLMNVVLGVYNKQFKNDCRYLLENVNNITYEQFVNLQEEYDLYRILSGKEADERLFGLVQEKYSGQMMQQDQVALLVKEFRNQDQNKEE